MKKIFFITVALFATLAFTSCESCSNKNNNSTQATIDSLANAATDAAQELENIAQSKIEAFGEGLFGTYVAELPAADASKISTTLVINADVTFTYDQDFAGKGEVATIKGEVVDGNFETQVITLQAEDGMKMLFKVLEGGNLLLLNEDGTEPTDVAAYTFVRK